jgi:hypothetical protein
VGPDHKVQVGGACYQYHEVLGGCNGVSIV